MRNFGNPYGPSNGWEKINRVLTASFRLGVFFGVELRVLWIGVVLLPLIFFSSYKDSGMPMGLVLAASLIIPITLFLIIYTHEMMHIVAGWMYNIRTSLITLSPMGGLAHMDSPATSPRSEMIISLAGPAVHLVWLAVFFPIWWFIKDTIFNPEEWLSIFFWNWIYVVYQMNLVLMIFNLLPIYPMDGGRVLRAFLAGKMHPNRATIIAAKVGMFGAGGLAIYGITQGGMWSFIMIAIAIRVFLDCKQAQIMAQHTEGPYGAALRPWENTGNFGNQFGGQNQTGKLKGFFEKRKEKKAQKEADAEKQLKQDVDAILDKINEVGINGITAKERKVLERASKRGRG